MTSGLDVLRWAVAIFFAGLALGIAGVSVYAALLTRPSEETPTLGRLVYRFGQVLVLVAMLLVAGAILGAGVVGGLAVFGR